MLRKKVWLGKCDYAFEIRLAWFNKQLDVPDFANGMEIREGMFNRKGKQGRVAIFLENDWERGQSAFARFYTKANKSPPRENFQNIFPPCVYISKRSRCAIGKVN